MSLPSRSFSGFLPRLSQFNPQISSSRRPAADPYLFAGRQNQVHVTTSDGPLESVTLEEDRWLLREDLAEQTKVTKASSDFDDYYNEDYDEQGDNDNLTHLTHIEDNGRIYQLKDFAQQEILINDPFLSASKHTTLSEDRTSESGWNKKRLAAVLSQVSRHPPPAKNGSNSKAALTDYNSSHPSKFDSGDALFDIGPNALEPVNVFDFLDGPGITSEDTENIGFQIRTSPPPGVEQDLRQDKPVNIKMTSFAFSGDENVLRRQDYPEIEDQKLLRENFSDANNNKECGYGESLGPYRKLIDRINALEQENVLLKSWIDPNWNHQGRPFFQVIHQIEGDGRIFFNPPSWRRESLQEGIQYVLKGSSLSMRKEEYLKRSGNLAFAVFKSYASDTVDGQDFETPPLPNPEAEIVLFASDEMRRAIQNYLNRQPDFKQLFPSFDVTKEISSPYRFWYCTRASYESTLQEMPPHQRALVKLFGEWVNANYETEYASVDDQIARGVISCQSMKYLVRPGDPLILQESGRLQAYQAMSWADGQIMRRRRKDKEEVGFFNKAWTVSVWSYEFDGAFYQKPTTLDIELDVASPHEEVELSSLKVTPLEYAMPDVRQKLEQRGKTNWACRKKKFISYSGDNNIDSLNNNSERFMIDFMTYSQLYPPEKPQLKIGRTEIPSERMAVDEPPSAPEIFFFPSHIVGFNLRRKKWVDLEVDLIKEVEWNKTAFESLVVDEETKELVQALITSRLVAEKGADMIEDKGNGLTILLHGGPGTGKTFTAESVAELAEKPLYRVTCGDIGTKPEEVENYMESALHLGKIWDCVVLLDEADVFLQERNLSDLQRNALVTVFLRVLEYYDGILILTSNRVGTLDEAFKSRIQASLHYPNLNRSQRHKIWRNLINRFKRLEQPDIDFDDIECYISELAEQEMNGRQIRNSITTARQLARFKGRNMRHADLKHVISLAGRFEKYLSDVKEGYTDDVIARESGYR
ncbi:hypothetical protein TMatcc_009994 [Talaromyces marneffei ATCC 18224]